MLASSLGTDEAASARSAPSAEHLPQAGEATSSP